MTNEQRETAHRLRSEGHSYSQIAAQLGCSLTCAWAACRASAPPSPDKPVRPKTLSFVPRSIPSSVPLKRIVRQAERNQPQPTKPEMYRQLAIAVRNTH